MALKNFSWVLPDKLARSDIPGRGSGSDLLPAIASSPLGGSPDEAFGITIFEIIDSQPLQFHEYTPHIHKNSIAAIMQEIFEKLPPEGQHFLKLVKALISNKP